MLKIILWPVHKTAKLSYRAKDWLMDVSERLETKWFGKPSSLSWLGWKTFDKDCSSKNPFLYWITDKLIPFFAYDVFYSLSNFCWEILHRWHPDHQYNIIRTTLKPGYYDVDTLLVEACKNLIKRYVEDDEQGVVKLQEKIVWFEENEKENAVLQVANYRDALKVYNWLIIDREAMAERIESLTHERYGNQVGFEIMDFIGGVEAETKDHPDRPKYDLWRESQDDTIFDLEKELFDKDTDALKLMAEIRGGLWN